MRALFRKSSVNTAFTLIELSIVMVIIGLIVGGILVGRDLVASASVRAQISQIEQYNRIVNAFKGKYGYLPGDIPNPDASSFGFVTRGTFAGEGDGNGVIEGSNYSTTGNGIVEGVGEAGVFWVDLSTAKLINGNFNTAREHSLPSASVTDISSWFPAAVIGQGNYVYVWSNGFSQTDRYNYFGISAVTLIESTPCLWCLNSSTALTTSQAYAMDKKVDDGFPNTGKVQALYLPHWVGRAGTASNAVAVTPSSTTCYDNGGVTSTTPTYTPYSVAGNALNCAISFRFQ